MIISGPIERKTDKNESMYRVRWFRGNTIMPTGLFQAWADFSDDEQGNSHTRGQITPMRLITPGGPVGTES